MRYLTEGFALAALRRGVSIEQFLGRAGDGAVLGIRWVEIVPTKAGYEIVPHEYLDVGDENGGDISEFPPLAEHDEDDWGEEISVFADPREAFFAARDAVGAALDRWVNFGVAADDYRDYVRAGRPAT